MSGTQRRASILEASTPIFAQRGFHGTTTRDLRSAAGTTQGAIYVYSHDKRGLYRAVLEKQAQEVLAALLDATKPESRELDETTWLADLAHRVLARMEADPIPFRLFLFSALEQDACSSPLLRLHGVLTRHIESRLACGHGDETERALLAQCLVGMVFHFGLLWMLEGKWPCGVAREQIVKTVVRTVLGSAAPGTRPRD
ncbi:MAG: TetR/AcrR family transcriptional regulator [Acidobacteriota bacterium]